MAQASSVKYHPFIAEPTMMRRGACMATYTIHQITANTTLQAILPNLAPPLRNSGRALPQLEQLQNRNCILVVVRRGFEKNIVSVIPVRTGTSSYNS